MTAGIAVRAGVIALAAALLLAGCGTPLPAGSNDSQSDPSSPENTAPNKPAVVTLADTAPVPFVDLDCASLVPAAVAKATIKAPVTPQPVVLSQGYLLTDGLPSVHEPMTFSTQLATGFTCEWSNGEPQVFNVAQNADYAGVILDVLPNATEAWASHLEYLSTVDGTTEYCTAAYEIAECAMEALVDGTWYALRSFDVNVAAGVSDAAVVAVARTVIDAAAASVAAATPTTAQPVVLGGTASLSHDCNQFFTSAELNAAVGASLTLDPTLGDNAQVYTLGAAADNISRVDYCSWHLTGNEDGYYNMALMAWLQGGEWAFSALQSGGGFATATEIDVAGLTGKETAYVECIDGDRCSVDLLVSHDWVWFSIWLDSSVSAVSPTAAAAAVAATIVEKIG